MADEIDNVCTEGEHSRDETIQVVAESHTSSDAPWLSWIALPGPLER